MADNEEQQGEQPDAETTEDIAEQLEEQQDEIEAIGIALLSRIDALEQRLATCEQRIGDHQHAERTESVTDEHPGAADTGDGASTPSEPDEPPEPAHFWAKKIGG